MPKQRRRQTRLGGEVRRPRSTSAQGHREPPQPPFGHSGVGMSLQPAVDSHVAQALNARRRPTRGTPRTDSGSGSSDDVGAVIAATSMARV